MCLLQGPTPVATAITRATEMLAEAAANPVLQANVMAALAELKAMQKSFDDARVFVQEARRTYERLGLRLALVGLLRVSGIVELLAGDALEAEHAFREGMDLTGVDFPTWRAYQATLLAESLYMQERYEEARELIDSAEPENPDELEGLLPWAVVKARLLAREGAAEEGELLLRDLAVRAQNTDALNVQGLVSLALAEVLWAADRPADARDAAAESAELFQQKGNLAGAERAAALLGEPARR
jgi:tetratricopeptide (TPR) repeat protein